LSIVFSNSAANYEAQFKSYFFLKKKTKLFSFSQCGELV